MEECNDNEEKQKKEQNLGNSTKNLVAQTFEFSETQTTTHHLFHNHPLTQHRGT